MKWFTSDNHFYHKNVIQYCNRPFASLEEMHDEMISRWNQRIAQDDTVYVLGDFAFCGTQRTKAILHQLRGKKILIKGNHDEKSDEVHIKCGFAEVHPSLTLEELGGIQKRIHLSHYPYYPTPEQIAKGKAEGYDIRYLEKRLIDQGDWLAHGHVHKVYRIRDRQINVGVDQHDFYPISEIELASLTT